MDGILAFPLNLALGVKKDPGVDPTVVLAGDLFACRLAAFVVNENVGFPIKIDILLDPLDLTLPVIVGPTIHLAVAIGAARLADDVALLTIIAARHWLLAARGVIG